MEVFDNFLSELSTLDPEFKPAEFKLEDEIAHIESTFYPEVMRIVQRDETFFSVPRVVCSVDLSEVFKTQPEFVWKNVYLFVLSSFFHGDIKEKIGTIVNTVKSLWSQSGQTNDEISKILEDDKVEDHLEELLEFLKTTRIGKLFYELFETVNVDEFINEFNIEDPLQVIEIIKNPENPVMKRLINKIKGLVEEKMQRGEITQTQIIADIETIKNKVQGMFGDVLNNFLGGNKADVPAAVLMGNTPEARRQRMIARLQKKQRNKNSQ